MGVASGRNGSWGQASKLISLLANFMTPSLQAARLLGRNAMYDEDREDRRLPILSSASDRRPCREGVLLRRLVSESANSSPRCGFARTHDCDARVVEKPSPPNPLMSSAGARSSAPLLPMPRRN